LECPYLTGRFSGVDDWPVLGVDRGKLWALLLFRWFVVVDTYEDLAKAGQVDPATFDPSCAREVLLARARADQKVYTSAFIVNFTSAHYQGPRVKGETKIYQSIERLTEAHRRLPEIYGRVGAAGSMERATQILTELPGVGLFNAYQMLVDATYLEGFLSFRDQNDWAAIAGPTSGTWKGLQMLGIANPKRDGVPAMCWLRDNQPALRGPRLTLANVANCLCEWSKYVRARDGGQKPREKYDPATAAPIDPTLWSMELIVHYSYHPRRPSRPSMAA
jgi:hypothetical protein